MDKISNLLKKFHLLQNKGFSKKLGQNFILDKNILDKIVDLAGNVTDEHVLEIGSGVGSLSERILLRHPKTFTIIEKDSRCIEAVRSWLKVDIKQEDALKVDYCDMFALQQPLKIIANLPYNIASKLLIKFCLVRYLIKDMTLMFQKEVADRIVAVPSTKDFGKLSVMAQTYFDCQIVKVLPPSVFVPAPKVTSALVYFKPILDVNVDIEALSDLTQKLFSKRRKILAASLSKTLLQTHNISPQERVENLSVHMFHQLIK